MIIKNSNLRKMLVENRYVILVIIVGIILFLSIINVINNFIKEGTKSQLENTTNTNSIVNNNQANNSKPIIGSTENKNNSTTNNNLSSERLIKDFLKYCNSHEIQNAYNLLSDECKEAVFFGNIEYFRKNYVESIFTSNKVPNIQIWLENYYITTYRVRLVEDILSTGNIKNQTNAIEDYYTVVQTEDGTQKLNINGYIARDYIKLKQGQVEGITISILKKDIFKDYEQYEIKVENKTMNTIMLDSKENVDSIYLLGSNNSKYSGFTYELDEIKTVIPKNTSKDMTIRFNKIYSNETIMRKMVFGDIILNYDNYNTILNKKDYQDRIAITIEM